MHIELELNRLGLEIVGYDKEGPKYSRAKVDAHVVKAILIEDYFSRGGKRVSKDLENAIDLTQDANKRFSAVLDAFTKTHKN